MSEARDQGASVGLSVPALVGLALGIGAALSALGLAPKALLVVGGGWLLLAGAWPLLARATPGPASPLKLVLNAGLLSPILALALDVAARTTLFVGEAAADRALALVLVILALSQLVGRGARVRRERLSFGAWAAIALALAIGGWSAWMLLRGNATRVSYHGLLHSGLALATERGLPPHNPWLAGEGLGYYWAWHALGGLVMRTARIAPTEAFAVIGVWAAVLHVLALQQLAAVLLRDGRRELAAIAAGLFGLNAIGGLAVLARGTFTATPESNGALLAALREQLVPSAASGLLWDPRVAFGLSKLGNLSSYPASLALLLGGFAAAGHALRHGRRPWIGLTALHLGASFAINPLVGAAGIGIVGLAALVHGRGARARFGLAAALVLCALPGVVLVQAARAAYSGAALGFVFDPTRLVWVGGPLALLLPPALIGYRSLRREIEPMDARRASLGLVALACVAFVAAALFVELPYANEYKFVRLAAFPTGILAAAGLAHGWRRGGAARVVAGAWILLGLAGAIPNLILGTSAYAHLAGQDLPLIEADRRLSPAGGGAPGADDVVAAYDFLATDPGLRALAPALIADVARERGEAFGAQAHAFTRADNLQAHEAAAFAAVDLWVDRPSQVLDAGDPTAARRMQAVSQLYRAAAPWDEATRKLVFESGRPLVMLVGEAERRARPAIDADLERSGFRLVFESGSARLYLSPGHELPRSEADLPR
ncbi:DUF2298 domain-containing protein [Engelhardtia mirabilis]|uniref:Uncharacterized protein n=1 Tax=Engelhardtia mirabilis TaxID=2528011 RepID=A0A518BPA4_9BACT|nr:hypothetical protein Pla133_38660 [Planctomycetes bacterium Pla133]QDV03090.1 hypothetical protein Pla86_38650 [Planctomycetes bacterium Pla86]